MLPVLLDSRDHEPSGRLGEDAVASHLVRPLQVAQAKLWTERLPILAASLGQLPEVDLVALSTRHGLPPQV